MGAKEFRRERIVLPSMSPGTERSIDVLRFGVQGARPKAYLQASLHADEIPAMLVLNHLVLVTLVVLMARMKVVLKEMCW